MDLPDSRAKFILIDAQVVALEKEMEDEIEKIKTKYGSDIDKLIEQRIALAKDQQWTKGVTSRNIHSLTIEQLDLLALQRFKAQNATDVSNKLLVRDFEYNISHNNFDTNKEISPEERKKLILRLFRASGDCRHCASVLHDSSMCP